MDTVNNRIDVTILYCFGFIVLIFKQVPEPESCLQTLTSTFLICYSIFCFINVFVFINLNIPAIVCRTIYLRYGNDRKGFLAKWRVSETFVRWYLPRPRAIPTPISDMSIVRLHTLSSFRIVSNKGQKVPYGGLINALSYPGDKNHPGQCRMTWLSQFGPPWRTPLFHPCLPLQLCYLWSTVLSLRVNRFHRYYIKHGGYVSVSPWSVG